MKVLMYLQLSRNKDGKYVMSADSNWNFNKHVIRMFKERGDNIDVIIPNQAQRFDTDEELIKDLKCDAKLLNILYASDVFGSRFFFNNDLVDIVKNIKYDLIWCNDPAISQNFKIFAAGKPKIISYNHWIDFPKDKKSPEEFDYKYRQFEAAVISDCYLLNSDFHVEEFHRQFSEIFKEIPKAAFFKFPPIASEHVGRDYSSRVKILFNHRLSSLQQYFQNYKNFCKVVEDLDVDVTVCNPENKIPKFEIPNKFKIVSSTSSEEYKNLLQTHNTQLNCFEYSGGWSMSMSDAISNDYNVFTLSHFGFKELTDAKSYTQCKDLNEIRSKLIQLIKNPMLFYSQNKDNYDFRTKNYSYEACNQKLEVILR